MSDTQHGVDPIAPNLGSNIVTTPYYESIQLIERLHRHFLDVLKVELDRKGVQDINNVQSMILYNIGDDELTVGELTIRGYYLGSNVSYNVKKMVENDYLVQERSVHDKRSIRVRLSEKGIALKDTITDMFRRHEEKIANTELTPERLSEMNQTLKMVERFWASQTNFTGLDSL
jgi:DNA-binding MarR family transcriptional regulator